MDVQLEYRLLKVKLKKKMRKKMFGIYTIFVLSIFFYYLCREHITIISQLKYYY